MLCKSFLIATGFACFIGAATAETIPLHDAELKGDTKITDKIAQGSTSVPHGANSNPQDTSHELTTIQEGHQDRAKQAGIQLRKALKTLETTLNRELSAILAGGSSSQSVQADLYSQALAYDRAYDHAMQAYVFVGKIMDPTLAHYRGACQSSQKADVVDALLTIGMQDRLRKRLRHMAFSPVDLSRGALQIGYK
jgi:hypothetical protein